jgi:SPP1 family predicted phage head-tail adaptor
MTNFINTDNWGAMFPFRATLQSETSGAKDLRGVPQRGWQDVAELVELPCVLEMKGGEELPGVDGATVTSTHTVTFQHFHAAITEKMRLIVDGQSYNILLAGSDPMKTCSILKIRKVTG